MAKSAWIRLVVPCRPRNLQQAQRIPSKATAGSFASLAELAHDVSELAIVMSYIEKIPDLWGNHWALWMFW